MLLPVVAFELVIIIGISDRFGAKKALFETAMYHARCGALVLCGTVQARVSFGPAVKKVMSRKSA